MRLCTALVLLANPISIVCPFLRRLFVKFASQNHDEEDLSSICVYLRLLRIIAGVIEAQRGDLFGSFCEYINTLRELKY